MPSNSSHFSPNPTEYLSSVNLILNTAGRDPWGCKPRAFCARAVRESIVGGRQCWVANRRLDVMAEWKVCVESEKT